MDELLKILVADEKKVAKLTVRYAQLKKNIENETKADKESRADLGADIALIKKSNSVIVDHYLGERKLSVEEIDKIIHTHSVE